MAIYDNKPEIFSSNGDGSYTYRWNIIAFKLDEETKWECNEVIVWATVSANLITQAVINQLWGKDYEQKLLNDYNAAKEGLTQGLQAEGHIQSYIDFLSQRKAIKEQIDIDCATLNIT